jgi:flagellar hook-associated protein 3 FlgL
MRISTSWAQQLGVNAMNAQQVKMSKTQMQLSSGLEILTPSDDPAAAVRTLSLQETIEKTKQYQDNIAMVRSRLNIEEGSLEAAENIMFRAKELTIQALNSTLTTEDRLAIKAEIDQLLEQMVGVANTKNANGEYVFSGDLSTTPAVAWDVEIGSYVYQGGVNQRALDIAAERKVADGDLGFNVFQNIISISQEANATVNGTELNKRSVFDTLQTLSLALESSYEIPEATVTGDRFMRFGVDYSLAPTTFDLTSDTGGPVTVALNGNYTDLDAVVSAINANPALAANNIEAQSNGNQIEFVSTTTGKTSSIRIDSNTGTFLTDFGFTSGVTGNGVDLGGELSGTKASTFLNYATSPASFELNDEIGNKQTITLNTNYANHAALILDIQTQITGSPIDGKIEVDSTANPIQFRSVSTGGSASVQIKQVSGDFLENTGFVSGDTGRVFSKTANDVLDDLDIALDNFLTIRTTVGARMRALDDQESQNGKFVLDMQTTLSETRDLDFAEAISRFNIEQIALQAAQQAFSRVQSLSLFNFL